MNAPSCSHTTKYFDAVTIFEENRTQSWEESNFYVENSLKSVVIIHLKTKHFSREGRGGTGRVSKNRVLWPRIHSIGLIF